MEIRKKYWNPTSKKLVTAALCALILYQTFRFVLPLVFPFVIAGIVAVVYYPFLRRTLEQTRLWNGNAKKILLTTAVILFYIGILIVLVLLGSYLFGQGRSILLNFPFYQAKMLCLVKNCCGRLDGFLQMEEGVCYAYMENLFGTVWPDAMTGALPKVTGYSVRMVRTMFQILFSVIVMVIATFFMVQDYDDIRNHMMQSEIGRSVCRVLGKSKDTLRIYIRAQAMIMLIDGILCTIAFLVIRQPYAFVLGPMVAIVDALPILGAGLVLLPYMLYLLLGRKVWQAGVLLLSYLGCQVIRQIIEPRMIGNQIGIKPLYTVISMYVGFKLFGIPGFLLGPIGMIIGKEVVEK